MRVYSVAQLRAWSAHRPPGYLATVLATGDVDGNKVRLTEAQWARLSRQFGGRPKRWFGDWIALLLDPVGRWLVTGKVACGCAGRQAALNRADAWVSRRLRGWSAR